MDNGWVLWVVYLGVQYNEKGILRPGSVSIVQK